MPVSEDFSLFCCCDIYYSPFTPVACSTPARTRRQIVTARVTLLVLSVCAAWRSVLTLSRAEHAAVHPRRCLLRLKPMLIRPAGFRHYADTRPAKYSRAHCNARPRMQPERKMCADTNDFMPRTQIRRQAVRSARCSSDVEALFSRCRLLLYSGYLLMPADAILCHFHRLIVAASSPRIPAATSHRLTIAAQLIISLPYAFSSMVHPPPPRLHTISPDLRIRVTRTGSQNRRNAVPRTSD